MPTLDLSRLAGLLERDRARNYGTGPTWAKLSDEAGREVYRAQRWIERRRPETYGLFGSDDELHVAVVDAFEDDSSPPNDVEDLAERLERRADEKWQVAVPLANVLPPTAAVTVAPGVVLLPTLNGDGPDLRESRRMTERLLGVSLDPGRRHDLGADDVLMDTRHTASLVLAETGTRRASEGRALSKARYAVAVWTLLAPPQGEVGMPLWPNATGWLPQPSIYSELVARAVNPDTRQPRAGTVLYTPDKDGLYGLPL